MQLSTKQAQTLSRLRSDLPFYAKNCLKIANKQQAGALTPFVFNRAQWLLHEKLEAQRKSTGMVRAILLKGRQMGSSTYTQARFFHNLQFNPNRKAFILAHAADSTEHIFSMASTFKANLPEPMKPDMLVDNQREMTFKNGSSYAVGTAGRATVGRGRTVQYFHSSETAFYDKATDITTGMFQAVARTPGTEFIIESTANGPGNFFYNMYHQSLEGNGDFQAIFIPWYWQDEYTAQLRPDFELTEEEMSLLRLFQKDGLTKEHLQWRRLKLAEMEGETWRFMQEYPCVCGDSSVVTTAGVKALREIVVGDVLPQGRVLKTMNKGVKACVKITTEDGHQLVCTPEHEVLTDEGFVPAQESLGKRIVLTPGVETPAEKILVPVHKAVKAQIEATPELARLVGYFVGGGSLSDNTFSFVNNVRDEDIKVDLMRILVKYTDNKIQVRKVSERGEEIRFADEGLARVFEALGVTQGTDYCPRRRKVCVPEWVMRARKQVKAEFLRGVIATDGYVYSSCANIRIFTKYVRFAYDLQIMFQSLGLRAKVYKNTKRLGFAEKRGKTYEGYEVTINAYWARRFHREYGFLSRWQEEHAVVNKSFVSYRDEHRKFSSRVVSVEEVGDREVFDLEVEGTHTFNASGLVVHNCTAEEAWKRVEEAFYGMQRVYLAVDRYATLLDQHVAHLPRILGVDPGRTGDPTVCCDRWGRKVMGFTQWPYQGETHDMVSAGKIARMIQTHDYDAVNIDVGYGTGIIDRLREMGYRGIVHGVTFGSGAIRNDVYRNKRAEMAAESRDWFDEDVAIPDDKIFLAELSALPKEKETSNNLQFIVSKDILREGLKRSTNHMDAFWCTFAFPVKRRPRTVSVHSGITVTNITGQRAQSPKTGLRTLQGVRRGVV